MTVDEALLDDPEALAAADHSGVLRTLATAGAQVREAAALSGEAGVTRLAEEHRPRAVVVASLGGSAVVSDILLALAGRACPVPVLVRRGGPLPAWVGPLDLVVAVSLSGRAAGPLALAAEAARRGARVVTVADEGSPLAQVGAGRGNVQVPLARGSRVEEGLRARSSRLSLWSLLVPVLSAADALGLVRTPPEVLAEVADRLDAEAEQCRPASEAFLNPAKTLALDLAGSVPVILADGDVAGAAAARAASMLARTARVPAVRGALPDDAGDVVATFGGPFATRPDDVFADPFLDDAGAAARLRLLLLRDAPTEPDAAPEVGPTAPAGAVVDAVAQTAADAGVRVSEVVPEPGPPLVRLAQLVARTDFAATYLALAGGIDPAASPHVADLRDRLG
ncbi:phosphoglucose isomerase-like protein [Kineococcus xinjiangensis]|uniref:Phosphoglucose isomerase-like protein n=1 Tax=Kineococcus xinjiangensis TaxID=512762 RepID=A0A2S6IU71_9ACTN|nr:SIS domain-containing protein [Kineococcus xinjiangensis]PPK97807.1 phosphoglucose isomerase-like protein [Kineococcus xinjiangensis]